MAMGLCEEGESGRNCIWVICGSVLRWWEKEGRNCAVIVQPPPEKRLEGCRDTMEMIKPNESWEGKWDEHVGG